MFFSCVIYLAPPSLFCLLTFNDCPLPIRISEFYWIQLQNGLKSVITNIHDSSLEFIQIVYQISLQWFSERQKPSTWYFPHMNPGKRFESQQTWLPETLCFSFPSFLHPLSIFCLFLNYLYSTCQHLTNYIFYLFSLFVAYLVQLKRYY